MLLNAGGGNGALAQAFVVSPFNFNIQRGSYMPASTNAQALARTKREITPQIFAQKPDASLSLLFPGAGGILLFNSKNVKDLTNVAGKLTSPSLVVVDTIYHNQVYRQKAGAADKYTFDMCYALRIDGKRYYTDFRPHSFISFRQSLAHHRQLFMVIAQMTGHDMYADKGYPGHFRIAVFDMQNDGIKLHFASEELPFHYGREFFDDNGAIKTAYNTQEQSFGIEIKGLNETYKGVWDGKVLKHLN
ncbi:hypothetical protein [Dyadobacter sp. 676]|uniref:Uncharacterized protein n=1 Tax=Dyadobacter sp. 676 TaxID=3088362 RepID=A0AAU8FJN0_9BACT